MRCRDDDAVDADPHAGIERNCCLFDDVPDELDVRSTGVFKTNISDTDDSDTTEGSGL